MQDLSVPIEENIIKMKKVMIDSYLDYTQIFSTHWFFDAKNGCNVPSNQLGKEKPTEVLDFYLNRLTIC